jgi:hypothetical protein
VSHVKYGMLVLPFPSLSGRIMYLTALLTMPRCFNHLQVRREFWLPGLRSRLVAPMSGNSFSVYDEVVALETPNGPITPDTSLPCGFRQQ